MAHHASLNFTSDEIRDAVVAALVAEAAAHGYIATRGIRAGDGHIPELLRRIACGEIALVPLAGEQRAVTPHLLRTTAACHLAERLNAWQLRAVMGHERIETTMRYVEAAHLNLDEAMRQASPVDNLRL